MASGTGLSSILPLDPGLVEKYPLLEILELLDECLGGNILSVVRYSNYLQRMSAFPHYMLGTYNKASTVELVWFEVLVLPVGC